MKQSKTGIWG